MKDYRELTNSGNALIFSLTVMDAFNTRPLRNKSGIFDYRWRTIKEFNGTILMYIILKPTQMNYTENFEGIKLDVQAVDITIGDNLQQEIRDMILRLRRHVSEVNWVDVYFNEKSGKSTEQRSVGVRLGIPGNDAFASDSGDNFMALLKSVEEKLRRQLEKR